MRRLLTALHPHCGASVVDLISVNIWGWQALKRSEEMIALF